MNKRQIFLYSHTHQLVGIVLLFLLYLFIVRGWDSCLWPTWLEYVTAPISVLLLIAIVLSIADLVRNRKISDKVFRGYVNKVYIKDYDVSAPFDIYKQYAIVKVGKKQVKAICPWKLEQGTYCMFCKSGKEYIIIGVIKQEATSGGQESQANNNT